MPLSKTQTSDYYLFPLSEGYSYRSAYSTKFQQTFLITSFGLSSTKKLMICNSHIPGAAITILEKTTLAMAFLAAA